MAGGRRTSPAYLVEALACALLGAGVEAGPLGAGLAAEETAGVGRRQLVEAGGVGLAVAVALVVLGHGRRLGGHQEEGDEGGRERRARRNHDDAGLWRMSFSCARIAWGRGGGREAVWFSGRRAARQVALLARSVEVNAR